MARKPVSGNSFTQSIKSFFTNIKNKFTSGKKEVSDKYYDDPVKDETVIFSQQASERIAAEEFGKTTFMPKMPADKLKEKKKMSLSVFVPRTKKPNFILGTILTIIKFAIAAIFIFVAIGIGGVWGLASAYLGTTPDLDLEKIEDYALTSYVYDSNGDLIATYTGSENRDWAALEEIPLHLQQAVIAVEDIRFYSHNGVDVKRLAGALIANLTSSKSEGGSTITQQLVKNTLLSSERSYKRKIQEAALAMELEKTYEKDEILEAYLNSMPLGGKIYGVKAAAKDYFGKELDDLSLKQIVCLAAITQYPYKYNPRTATYITEDVGSLQNRMNIVVERMYSAGYLTKEEYDATFVPKEIWDQPGFINQWKQEMNVLETSTSNELYEHPHFVEYVIEDVTTHFLRLYEMEDTKENRAKIDQEIRSKGYRINATIVPDAQNIVQNTLSEWDDYPEFKDSSKTVTTDSAGNETIQPQASATVIDHTKGTIVALVGSRNKPTAMKTYNRATDGGMPVGSSIKPIAVYTPAFDLGLSPATPIANLPVPIEGWDSEKGYPLTSQGTYGPVNIRKGVVSSLNIVAARTLMDEVTIGTSADYLIKMGVDPEHIDYSGYGLALGGSSLTSLELATCYAVLANDGYYLEPVSFTTVTDQAGNVVLDSSKTRKQYQVFEPASAWMIIDVLTDAVDHGTGTNAQIDGITTAGKTGTVEGNNGACFAGTTGYYASALWIGHDLYEPFVHGTSASNSSAPLWQAYMEKLHEGLEDRPISDNTAESLGLVKGTVCQFTGLAPNPDCPTFSDYYAPGTVPKEPCTGHTIINICKETGMMAAAACTETFAYVDSASLDETSPYKMWVGTEKQPIDTSQYCTIHGGNNSEYAYAQSVIGALGNTLNQYADRLSEGQKAVLTNHINNLRAIIMSGGGASAVNAPANMALAEMNGIISSLG